MSKDPKDYSLFRGCRNRKSSEDPTDHNAFRDHRAKDRWPSTDPKDYSLFRGYKDRKSSEDLRAHSLFGCPIIEFCSLSWRRIPGKWADSRCPCRSGKKLQEVLFEGVRCGAIFTGH